MRIAAIDIGTNSTRLLVADVTAAGIKELFRRSIVTRLGDKVDQCGRLSEAACDRVYEALDQYRAEWIQAGAERVAGVATSAVRESENGVEFQAEVRRRFDFDLAVIDGDDEARLTFAGACTSGLIGNGAPAVVIDIGGGSTEFIVGCEGELEFHVSTKIGAVRQSERHLRSDPPTDNEIAALLAEATAIIDDEVPAGLRARARYGIGVAGTPTVLASVDQELDRFDPWKVHGYKITRPACARLLERLANLPLAKRRNVTGLHPDRAPTIVAGAAILMAVMREFDLSSVTVSEHDILYGLALRIAQQ